MLFQVKRARLIEVQDGGVIYSVGQECSELPIVTSHALILVIVWLYINLVNGYYAYYTRF